MTKLVRDKIPALMGDHVTVAKVKDPKERLKWLFEKLREETEELITAGKAGPSGRHPSPDRVKERRLEELGDVLEVLSKIGEELGLTEDDITIKMELKAEKKGVFNEMYLLVSPP